MIVDWPLDPSSIATSYAFSPGFGQIVLCLEPLSNDVLSKHRKDQTHLSVINPYLHSSYKMSQMLYSTQSLTACTPRRMPSKTGQS